MKTSEFIKSAAVGAFMRGLRGFVRAPLDMVNMTRGAFGGAKGFKEAGQNITKQLEPLGRAGKVGNLLGFGTVAGAGIAGLPGSPTPGQPPSGVRFNATPQHMRQPNISRRLTQGIQNTGNAISPIMSKQELQAIYGTDSLAQIRAMTDPMRIQKRMKYQEQMGNR